MLQFIKRWRFVHKMHGYDVVLVLRQTEELSFASFSPMTVFTRENVFLIELYIFLSSNVLNYENPPLYSNLTAGVLCTVMTLFLFSDQQRNSDLPLSFS